MVEARMDWKRVAEGRLDGKRTVVERQDGRSEKRQAERKEEAMLVEARILWWRSGGKRAWARLNVEAILPREARRCGRTEGRRAGRD